jgi:hypothetical protein
MAARLSDFTAAAIMLKQPFRCRDVTVQPEMQRGRSGLVSLPPFDREITMTWMS